MSTDSWVCIIHTVRTYVRMYVCIPYNTYVCIRDAYMHTTTVLRIYVCTYVCRCSTHVPLRTVPQHASARWGVPRGAVAPGRACAHTWSGYSSEHALTIYHTLQVRTSINTG